MCTPAAQHGCQTASNDDALAARVHKPAAQPTARSSLTHAQKLVVAPFQPHVSTGVSTRQRRGPQPAALRCQSTQPWPVRGTNFELRALNASGVAHCQPHFDADRANDGEQHNSGHPEAHELGEPPVRERIDDQEEARHLHSRKLVTPCSGRACTWGTATGSGST